MTSWRLRDALGTGTGKIRDEKKKKRGGKYERRQIVK
jgi:hypothetical protein